MSTNLTVSTVFDTAFELAVSTLETLPTGTPVHLGSLTLRALSLAPFTLEVTSPAGVRVYERKN